VQRPLNSSPSRRGVGPKGPRGTDTWQGRSGRSLSPLGPPRLKNPESGLRSAAWLRPPGRNSPLSDGAAAAKGLQVTLRHRGRKTSGKALARTWRASLRLPPGVRRDSCLTSTEKGVADGRLRAEPKTPVLTPSPPGTPCVLRPPPEVPPGGWSSRAPWRLFRALPAAGLEVPRTSPGAGGPRGKTHPIPGPPARPPGWRDLLCGDGRPALTGRKAPRGQARRVRRPDGPWPRARVRARLRCSGPGGPHPALRPVGKEGKILWRKFQRDVEKISKEQDRGYAERHPPVGLANIPRTPWP
jgi:hypothetical protein